MASLTPFIFVACGLFWVVTGAWGTFSLLRNRRSQKTAEAADKTIKISKKARRWSGFYVLGVGLLCLACSFVASPVASFLFYSGMLCTLGGNWYLLAVWNKPDGEITCSRWGRRSIGANLFWVALGLAIVWFSSVRIGQAPTAAEPISLASATLTQLSPAESRLTEIVTQEAQQDFNEYARVGLVVGVIADGQELLLGFGKPAVGVSKNVDEETIFEIGSISKVFTGTLLAQQIERGELSLNDRVADLLPEGWELSEAAQDVTLGQLTTHTSGFPRLPSDLIGIGGIGKLLINGDPYRGYSEEQFRQAVATVQLESPPGEEHSYSNFGVGLLGYLLATHNGTDYETLVRDQVCQPLGMEKTVVTNTAWHDQHHATGYAGGLRLGPGMIALKSSYWLLPNHLAGAGAIRSNGSDMLKFLRANMGAEKTSQAESSLTPAIQLAQQEVFEVYSWRAIGMGWIRSYNDTLSKNILWHNGGTGGYRSYIGFTEDHKQGVFVLSNTHEGVDDLGQAILEAVARMGQKPATENGFAKVAPWTGVRWKDDQPIVQVEGRWAPLVSIDGIAIDRIIEFATEEYGEKARKRVAEDLVEVLATMGHDPDWDVKLGIATETDNKTLTVLMTEENRDQLRR